MRSLLPYGNTLIKTLYPHKNINYIGNVNICCSIAYYRLPIDYITKYVTLLNICKFFVYLLLLLFPTSIVKHVTRPQKDCKVERGRSARIYDNVP